MQRRNPALLLVVAIMVLVTLAIGSRCVWRRYQNFSSSSQEVSVTLSELERSTRQAQLAIETELVKAKWKFSSGMDRGRCDPAWRKVFYVSGRIAVTKASNQSSVGQMRLGIVRHLEALGYGPETLPNNPAGTGAESLDSGVVRISIVTQPKFVILLNSRCTTKSS